MLASHAFRPITSVYNKNTAVDSAFVSSLYRGIVGVIYGVFQVAVSCVFAVSFQLVLHIPPLPTQCVFIYLPVCLVYYAS